MVFFGPEIICPWSEMFLPNDEIIGQVIVIHYGFHGMHNP
jgi:hypothetical protein